MNAYETWSYQVAMSLTEGLAMSSDPIFTSQQRDAVFGQLQEVLKDYGRPPPEPAAGGKS